MNQPESMNPPVARHRIVLRYFNCRGRGQALRYLLTDHGIEFTDERVPADQSWHRDRAIVGGPFLSLPLLECDGHWVAQTLPIASYLSRRMGHAQHLDIQETALFDAVSSAAYLDLTCVIRELLRPRIMPQDEQWPGFFADFMATISGRLPAFERLLAVRGGPFFGGVVPIAADYFVFEAMDTWLELLGEPFAAALAGCVHLSAHRTALLARPRLRAYLGSGGRPGSLTASPHERSIRDRLHHWQTRDQGIDSP